MIVTSESFAPSSAAGFIVIEGVNGAGKTTLQQRMSEYFAAHGRRAAPTREPGGTALGAVLRPILLQWEEPVSGLAELLLFAADRAEHVAKVIRPALARQEIVISDRYYYSTAAFQGYGRGLDLDLISVLNRIAIDGLLPDLTILLDLEPHRGLERARKRQGAAGIQDTFEKQELEFQQRMREGFLAIARKCPEPVLVIDAQQTPEAIFAAVQPSLDKFCS